MTPRLIPLGQAPAANSCLCLSPTPRLPRSPMNCDILASTLSLWGHSAPSPSPSAISQAVHLLGRKRLLSLLSSLWAGSSGQASVACVCVCVSEGLAQRRLPAQVLQVQSGHPPWEVIQNRCASMVSMEIWQPGNPDG